MDLTSVEKKAIYEEIKAYVREHFGLNISNLYMAKIKIKYGIIERINYNISKVEDAKKFTKMKDKETAITEALKYFGMIE